jgi:hypothetical protein
MKVEEIKPLIEILINIELHSGENRLRKAEKIRN